MRPIKFRVWDINHKVYDVPAYINYDNSGHIENIDTYHGLLREGEFELEQYTGLNDSELVEIYEGDIVEIEVQGYVGGYEREVLYTGAIQYSANEMRYTLNQACKPKLLGGTPPDEDAGIYGWDELAWGPECLEYCDPEDIAVIGNVHENPELLEVEK